MKRLLGAGRRLRLGTRLALGQAALALVVFAVVGTALVTLMRGYLSDRLDEQLTKSQVSQSRKLVEHPTYPPQQVYGWHSAVFQVDNGVARLDPSRGDPNRGDPQLPDVERLAEVARDAAQTEVLRTVHLRGAGDYRVRACPLREGQPGGVSQATDSDEVLVSAAPQGELDSTVRQLIMVLLVTFAIALAALVFVGRLVLRKGLRPLSDMAATAHDITSHDLTRSADLPVRVSGTGGGVEVEELRTALNRMLDHIDASLAVRTAANERLRRFVADASHELRTPLTSIRGYADLFNYAAANEPAERDAHLAKIRAETARMSVLVDDLLLLARLDSADAEAPLRLERTDLAELATAAAEAFRVANPDHPLELDIATRPLRLAADPVRLRQVLDNLLANVAAHTPQGTVARLSVHADEGWAVVRVADTGPGIPAEHRARIFDRFYRVDDSRSRSHGGSGLGLAVVQMLIEAHGGTVALDSEPGRTVFTVRLPGAEGVA